MDNAETINIIEIPSSDVRHKIITSEGVESEELIQFYDYAIDEYLELAHEINYLKKAFFLQDNLRICTKCHGWGWEEFMDIIYRPHLLSEGYGSSWGRYLSPTAKAEERHARVLMEWNKTSLGKSGQSLDSENKMCEIIRQFCFHIEAWHIMDSDAEIHSNWKNEKPDNFSADWGFYDYAIRKWKKNIAFNIDDILSDFIEGCKKKKWDKKLEFTQKAAKAKFDKRAQDLKTIGMGGFDSFSEREIKDAKEFMEGPPEEFLKDFFKEYNEWYFSDKNDDADKYSV